MAARENQGYLVAIIILVLISLILALVAFLGVSKATEYADNRDALASELAFNKNLATAYETEADILKAYIGKFGMSVAEVQTQIDSMARLSGSDFTENQKNLIADVVTDVKNVKQAYEGDMKQFIGTNDDPAKEFTWRSLNDDLASVLNKKHNDLNVERNERLRISREAAAEIEGFRKSLDETKKTLETTRTDLKSEQDRHLQKEQALTKEMNNIKAMNETTNRALDNTLTEAKRDKDLLNDKINKTSQENVALKDKVDRYEREVFDLPDGQIVRSSPANNAVHINLGSDDALRRNRTFAVFDQAQDNFADGKQKAMIEVTDVTGPHQAVARITDEDPQNPILKGDYILTATWDPGYAVPIALVGKFDLDGDGVSDTQKLVRMIERNGGRVVAQHDEKGNITGKIDSSTRYVVLGEEPDIGPETDRAVLDAINELLNQSKANSVQEIDTRKLLNWMGVHGQANVERFDAKMGNEFRKRDTINSLKSHDR